MVRRLGERKRADIVNIAMLETSSVSTSIAERSIDTREGAALRNRLCGQVHRV